MCLIVLAFRRHPGYPLVFAANRDEFLDRPAATAQFWTDHPDVLAGRDLKAGGTWCGITRSGRFAAITNVREPAGFDAGAPSRGRLVTDFLTGDESPRRYLDRVAREDVPFNGYNLIVGDVGTLCYYGNRQQGVHTLAPGVYGLSNHLLDTPWPKVVRAKAELERQLAHPDPDVDALFRLLADETMAPDADLPETGVGWELERRLSPAFIRAPGYGTRTSTVILIDAGGTVTFAERTHSAQTGSPETRTFNFPSGERRQASKVV